MSSPGNPKNEEGFPDFFFFFFALSDAVYLWCMYVLPFSKFPSAFVDEDTIPRTALSSFHLGFYTHCGLL